MKKMLMAAAVYLMAAMTFAAQCAATTKKGTQCKRQTLPGSQFCWQHGGARKAQGESAPEAKLTPAPVSQTTVTAGQCKGVTTAGRRCNRKASPGSDYCWQHAK